MSRLRLRRRPPRLPSLSARRPIRRSRNRSTLALSVNLLTRPRIATLGISGALKDTRMSLIGTTSLGRFRAVVDQQKRKSFLFECPVCGEWLPMSEEHLNGSRDVQHLRKGEPDWLCEYFEAKVYGAT